MANSAYKAMEAEQAAKAAALAADDKHTKKTVVPDPDAETETETVHDQKPKGGKGKR